MKRPMPDPAFCDSEGVPLAVGDSVHWKRYGSGSGTVRAFTFGYTTQGKPGALVDDGDPANPDGKTNGFRATMWIETKLLTRVDPGRVGANRFADAVVQRVRARCPACAGAREDCEKRGWIR